MPRWDRPPLVLWSTAVAALVAVLVLAFGCGAGKAAAACTRFAATNGSDSAPGSADAPFRTAQRLLDSLGPGEVGCLQAGATFAERLRGNHGGAPGRPITLASAPGGRATLLGEIYIPTGSNDIVFSNLKIDGRDAARVSPSVNADRISFLDNDVTNDNTAICFHLGKPGEGVATDVVIDGNRIHNCGRLPATGFDHGIYVNTARSTRITNNYIYDNADYGIQLYPDAQRTLVANNVIDGNGRGLTFSGEGGTASSNNTVINNIISNSKDTTNLESYWGGPVGSGNKAVGNCLWNGAQGNVGQSQGFSLSDNITADPQYVDRAAKDFALRPGSPCAGKGPQTAAPALAPVGATGPPHAAKARKRMLTGTARWLPGRTLQVKVRSLRRGRVKMVARVGDRVIGACTRGVTSRRGASCHFRPSVRLTGGGATAVVAVHLAPRHGRAVRIRLARRVPALKTLTAMARLRSHKLIVGVRSRTAGQITMVARAGDTRLGVCRRHVVRHKSVSCRFRVSPKAAAAGPVVVVAALKPRSGSPIQTSVAARR